eukprot:Filipodium_phascolosomae@DN4757_c0_g1_i1.p1
MAALIESKRNLSVTTISARMGLVGACGLTNVQSTLTDPTIEALSKEAWFVEGSLLIAGMKYRKHLRGMNLRRWQEHMTEIISASQTHMCISSFQQMCRECVTVTVERALKAFKQAWSELARTLPRVQLSDSQGELLDMEWYKRWSEHYSTAFLDALVASATLLPGHEDVSPSRSADKRYPDAIPPEDSPVHFTEEVAGDAMIDLKQHLTKVALDVVQGWQNNYGEFVKNLQTALQSEHASRNVALVNHLLDSTTSLDETALQQLVAKCNRPSIMPRFASTHLLEISTVNSIVRDISEDKTLVPYDKFKRFGYRTRKTYHYGNRAGTVLVDKLQRTFETSALDHIRGKGMSSIDRYYEDVIECVRRATTAPTVAGDGSMAAVDTNEGLKAAKALAQEYVGVVQELVPMVEIIEMKDIVEGRRNIQVIEFVQRCLELTERLQQM